MKFEIRNRWNDALMYEVEAYSLKEAVEKLVRGGKSLQGANLTGADVTRADLSGAYLTRADLSSANLSGANLTDANLYGANLYGAYLSSTNLSSANLTGADVTRADLSGANLSGANLIGANLSGAYLTRADLSGANLTDANLYGANLCGAYLYGAYLTRADLSGANLSGANLSDAYLRGANLRGANLSGADLTDTKGLVKLMGVSPGNVYWKRFGNGLNNNGFQFYVGLNTLRDGEVFAADDRVNCSYPGFHFASRSWCAVYYPDRPLEARIRIPEDAQINEPWASDGKASADKIEILQVFEVKTGKDVTDQFRRPEEKGKKGKGKVKK